MFEYAITVKKTRKPVSHQHYCDYLDKMKEKGQIGNVYFELTRGLHLHYTLRSDKPIDCKKPYKPSKHGWNIWSVPIYNSQGWNTYCRKDHDDQVKELKELHSNYDSDEYIEQIIPTKEKRFKGSVFKKYAKLKLET